MEKSAFKDLVAFDSEIRNEYGVVCGVDEAGRGPLAGDVYAAAVVFDFDTDINILCGLNDSKKLTEKKREYLFDIIINEAAYYSIASASVSEIEELNILNASMLAMRRAVDGLGTVPNIALVDGNSDPKLKIPAKTIIGGDGKSAVIAAASVLAKVSRDRYMLKTADEYPEYMFQKHKGYGTKLHYEMLEKYGVSPVHRKSFLKKIIK